jgi:hypothetical protein
VSTRVEQMLEEYIELPFPAGQQDIFGSLAIYVRKGEWSGKGEHGTAGCTHRTEAVEAGSLPRSSSAA